MSTPSEHAQLIEAALFISTSPKSAQTLAKKLNLSASEIQAGINMLRSQLTTRGIRLIQSSAGYELAVAPNLRQQIASISGDLAPTLSQSSLEVLTIIAYEGPCQKAVIDEIRATPSDNSLRALMSRDLIAQKKSHNNDGAMQYELTSFAWRCLGLAGRDALPPKPKTKTKDQHEAK
ncbi:SMC-Scp complex subunit ScpB [bacterium]|nr:MAG: SMC-Scp complex subunit ScpB [bacterium]